MSDLGACAFVGALSIMAWEILRAAVRGLRRVIGRRRPL